MYEFEITNRYTGEVIYLYGYNLKDGFRRRPALNPDDWGLYQVTYID